jgi:hypothetical protein
MKFGLRELLSAATGIAALAAVPAYAGEMHWSGDVDDTATIRVSGRDVRVDGNLKGVRNSRADWRGSLPRGGTRVYVRDADGRGRIRVLQQPSRENGYTAVVGIRDSDAGRGHYDFTLQWDDRGDWNRGDWNRSGYRDDDRYRNGRRDPDWYRHHHDDRDRDDRYDRDRDHDRDDRR